MLDRNQLARDLSDRLDDTGLAVHVVGAVDVALEAFADAVAAATTELDELSITTGHTVGGRRYTVTIAVRS